jgi:hypothetical protein
MRLAWPVGALAPCPITQEEPLTSSHMISYPVTDGTAPLPSGRAPARTDPLPLAALLVMALMGFLLIATETMPAGLLPQISAGLDTSEGTAGQLVSAYALGTVLATIPLVAATRARRRKPVLLVGILGFLVANTVTALSPDVVLSLAMRVVAGAFSGLLWGMLAGYARRITTPWSAGGSATAERPPSCRPQSAKPAGRTPTSPTPCWASPSTSPSSAGASWRPADRPAGERDAARGHDRPTPVALAIAKAARRTAFPAGR